MQIFEVQIFVLVFAAKQLDKCAVSILWRSGSFTSLPTPDVVCFILNIWGMYSSISCSLNLCSFDSSSCWILLHTNISHWYVSFLTKVPMRSIQGLSVSIFPLWFLFQIMLGLNYKCPFLFNHCRLPSLVVLSGVPTIVSWTLNKSFVLSSTPTSAIYT